MHSENGVIGMGRPRPRGAVGARQTWVMMEHTTKAGEAKIVPICTCPASGLACVSRIHTDLAVIEVGADGLQVVEMAEGVSFDALQAATAVPLRR